MSKDGRCVLTLALALLVLSMRFMPGGVAEMVAARRR